MIFSSKKQTFSVQSFLFLLSLHSWMFNFVKWKNTFDQALLKTNNEFFFLPCFLCNNSIFISLKSILELKSQCKHIKLCTAAIYTQAGKSKWNTWIFNRLQSLILANFFVLFFIQIGRFSHQVTLFFFFFWNIVDVVFLY